MYLETFFWFPPFFTNCLFKRLYITSNLLFVCDSTWTTSIQTDMHLMKKDRTEAETIGRTKLNLYSHWKDSSFRKLLETWKTLLALTKRMEFVAFILFHCFFFFFVLQSLINFVCSTFWRFCSKIFQSLSGEGLTERRLKTWENTHNFYKNNYARNFRGRAHISGRIFNPPKKFVVIVCTTHENLTILVFPSNFLQNHVLLVKKVGFLGTCVKIRRFMKELWTLFFTFFLKKKRWKKLNF